MKKLIICILMYLLAIANIFHAIDRKNDKDDWSLLWAWFSGFQLAAGLVLTFQLAGIM